MREMKPNWNQFQLLREKFKDKSILTWFIVMEERKES